MGCIRFSVSLGFMILLFASGKAQDVRSEHGNKGKIKLYWGWNTAYYTKSDIHFKGSDYDFTLGKVKAVPEVATPYYWGFSQTNFRLGYFINDHYEIAVGSDHMRYIVDDNQEVDVSGYTKDKQYDGSKEKIPGDLLTYYKHTNGLNYIHVELTRYDDMTRYIRTNPKYIQVSALLGAGAGILYPKSFVRLMDRPSSDEWSFAGFGAAVKAGLNVTLFKYFFIQSELKGGYINMPWVHTANNSADKASQDFFFVQPNILVGVTFRLF